jgi:hypothetical protein
MASKVRTVRLADIVVDDAMQSRATLDVETIERYQADMEAGDDFPPLGVVSDGTAMYLYSGFHRFRAFANRKTDRVPVEVIDGTRRDAILLAAGQNHGHGRPRTNADKRRAVTMLLADGEWAKRSTNWIAEQCRVHHSIVDELRGEKSEVVSGKDGKDQASKKKQVREREPENDETANTSDKSEASAIKFLESMGNATPPEKLPPREPVEEQDAPKVVPADLPGHLRDVFADPDLGNLIHQLATLNDQASAIAKRIGRWIKGKSMAYVPWFRTEQALDQAAELARPAELLLATMNAAQPGKPCVACGGDLKGCPECHRTGWMPAWKVREMTRGVA